MSNANKFVLTAVWRALPATDRWQTFQSQLSRTTTTDSHPWTPRCRLSWRALPARASGSAFQARS
jgi:hypothetical protein